MKKVFIAITLLLFVTGIFAQECRFSQNVPSGDIIYYNKNRAEGGRLLVHGTDNSVSINYANDFTGGVKIMPLNSGETVAIFNDFTKKYQLTLSGWMKAKALDVTGAIRAEEVKIEKVSNWSDFVFNKDYKLPTLKEVESHIAEKGTLPDIPSEQEVKENGIDVGEMQAKLLQKIEELTLYVIELKKENEAQDVLIKKLLEEKGLNE